MTYLSYSGYKSYSQCPFEYWHKYVNKTRLDTPENGVNTLYGSTVGLVFEAFYRDKIWKYSNCVEQLEGLVEPYMNKAIQDQMKQGRVLDWSDEKANYKKPQDVAKDAKAAIPAGVETIRENKFVGPFMEAEMKLDRKIGPHVIGGRSDFVIRRTRPLGDLIILDGKGSKHRGKYIDSKPKKEGEPLEGVQLKWYSMLYRENFGVIPDGLGYLFWRYSGKEAVEWVPFKESDLTYLKEEVLSVIDRIDRTSKTMALAMSPQAKDELRQELFPAQAGRHCILCAFAVVCEEGKKVMARQKRAKSSIPSGVTELSLGSEDESFT